MYTVKIEQSFDAAHFLWGYQGKCKNIHGHRWRVTVSVSTAELACDGPARGMVVDFSDVKTALGRLTDELDHALIYETGSLREATVSALCEEGFKLVELPFRPTSENFAKYIYDRLSEREERVSTVEVYETPGNCAAYSRDE